MPKELSIELHAKSAFGAGAHYYWVMRDLKTGRILKEMHGWPMDPKTGRPGGGASTAFGGSRLGFFQGSVKRDANPHIVVDAGSRSDMNARWAEGEKIGKFLDQQNIPYPIMGMGTNSNSFTRTIGNAMGYDVHTIIDPKSGETMGIAPGNEDLFKNYPNAPKSQFRTNKPKKSGVTVDPREIDPLTQQPREYSPQKIREILKQKQEEEFGERHGALDLDPHQSSQSKKNQFPGSLGLSDQISANNDVEPSDARKLKHALIDLGFYEAPDFGVNGFVDTALLEGVQEFQKQNDLPADSIVKPGGPTEGAIAQSLQHRRRNRRSNNRPLNSPQPFVAG